MPQPGIVLVALRGADRRALTIFPPAQQQELFLAITRW